MNKKIGMALAILVALGGSVLSMGVLPALELAPFAITILGFGALISARSRNESV